MRFLCYLYRITQGVCRHFDVEDESRAPETVVRFTVGQQRAWHAHLQAASQQQAEGGGDDSDDSSHDGGTDDSQVGDDSIQASPVQDQLGNLWMLLISHDTSAQR